MDDRANIQAPDLGNSPPFALLTGAGFSCNWRGLPAKKIWEKIQSAPVLATSQPLQRVLAGSVDNYERALYLASTECTPEEHHILEEAVIDEFRSQEQRIARDLSQSQINRHKIQELLSLFGPGPGMPNWHKEFDTGYIFTLNQDWLVERLWEHPPVGSPSAVVVPGIPPRTQRFPQHWNRFETSDIRSVPDATRWPLQLKGAINYLKLHGSFEWRTSDGLNVLVMGGGKAEQLARFPILVAFFDVFRRVIEKPGLRLMIIGYGFRDEHVNTLIADAARQRPGERWILVLDVQSRTDIERILRSPDLGKDGRAIADAILDSSSETLAHIFPEPHHLNHRSEEYRRKILERFFRITAPG